MKKCSKKQVVPKKVTWALPVTEKGGLRNFTGENMGTAGAVNVITAPQTRYVVYFPAVSVTILIEAFFVPNSLLKILEYISLK